MDYISTCEIGRTFVLILHPGDMVLESIEKLISKEGIKNAVVVSGIGTLDKCVLHTVLTTGYPAVQHFESWDDKPLGLSSIDGIIADGQPHLHAVICDHEKTYSGHLERECRVLYLAEIVIVELKSINLTREYNEKDILELVIKK